MSFVMLKIKQHLCLEIRKFFNNGYGKYQALRSSDSLNGAVNDLANSGNVAENDWTDWQFSVSQALG